LWFAGRCAVNCFYEARPENSKILSQILDILTRCTNSEYSRIFFVPKFWMYLDVLFCASVFANW
jgi:hypothetical protein